MSEFDVPKGEQYVSEIGPPPSVVPEKIVNPFAKFQERRDQRLELLRSPPGQVNTSELCWGEAPQFQDSVINPFSPGGFNTRKPKDEEPPKPPDRPQEFTWTEEDDGQYKRKTEKIRVENPDDEEQYVMVERIKEMYFKSPSQEPFKGARHKFIFKNKKPA